MTRWHAAVTFTTAGGFGEDEALEALDALVEHGAAVSPAADARGGEIALSVTAESAVAAAVEAERVVTGAVRPLAGAVDVVAIEASTEEAMDRRLAEPIFPDVVGFAEIADMAGVTRQRARAFAKIDGFPAPVITTAQGALMTRVAVARWLETRSTRPGRPRKAAAEGADASPLE